MHGKVLVIDHTEKVRTTARYVMGRPEGWATYTFEDESAHREFFEKVPEKEKIVDESVFDFQGEQKKEEEKGDCG